MYTLDTNAIIYYLAGDAHAVSVLQHIFSRDLPVYISAITEAELFSFRNLTPRDEALIERLISTVVIVPVDSQVARLAARTRRASRLPLPDSLIAATALRTGSTLLTRNTRDFRNVQGLALEGV